MAVKTQTPRIPSNGKFDLPLLGPLDSLTAGTDIPPPPDSPIEEKPSLLSPSAAAISNDQSKENQPPVTKNGAPPMTADSERTGTMRRFLSLKSLNASYNKDDPASPVHNRRPSFAASFITNTSPGSSKPGSARRSKSGSMLWFRKKHLMDMADHESQENKGPPPPKLPELKLSGDIEEEGLGANEMFKDIK